jgi:glutaminyl-peptide cyclotransferase
VEEQAFNAATPRGAMRMTNVLVKIPGESEEILLLASHYDTLAPSRLPGFVGAVDGASGNGVMLELARLLCARERKNRLNIWIAFFDGEEAIVEWSDTDSTYGSRELAARMALASELKRLKAMILADLVGEKDARFKREANSTPWLADMVWEIAAQLGYRETFVEEAAGAIEDDHVPFVRRKIPAVNIIDLEYEHWHTTGDTLDKISARTLGITGHVILETIAALEKKFQGRS